MKKINWADVLLVLLGAIVLCSFALYNQFPFVYSDSGTYISSGFTGNPPDDRPLLYGLFIRHSSLNESLWFTVLAQTLLLSYVIYGFIRDFIPAQKAVLAFVVSVVGLTLFTGVSLFAGELLPDFFAPISLLCLLSLLYAELSMSRKIILSIIYLFSLCVHLSHSYIQVMVLAVLSIGMLVNYLRKKKSTVTLKRLLLTGTLACSSFLLVPTIHYACGGKFQSQNFSQPFFINRLISFGIMKEYLDDKCRTKNYTLCKYKDNLPWDFIWNENSPMNLEGGLEKNKAEYDAIIHDIFTTPRYIKRYLIKAGESAFKLFFNFDLGDSTGKEGFGSAPLSVISDRLPHQNREYLGSLQNRELLDFKAHNEHQRILIYLSFLLALLILFYSKLSQHISSTFKQLIIVCVLFFFMNAGICGTISTIAPRFQSRLIWVLPLILIMVAVVHSSDILKGFKREDFKQDW